MARVDVFRAVHEGIMGLRGAGLGRAIVVGVNGTYTAGKTVFTEGLGEYLVARGERVQVIHYDDFHRPFSAMEWTEETEVEAFYEGAFEPEKLVRDVLAPLRAAGALHRVVDCVDLGAGTYTQRVRLDIDAETIVLLEGVLLFRPPVDGYLDYRVYLEISPEEVLRRARLRDVPRFGAWILGKFVTRYLPVQARYVAEWGPAGRSDLVVGNEGEALG